MSTAALTGIPAVLLDLGMDPELVLAELGVEATVFEGATNVISYKAVGSVVQHCAIRTGCPYFGLLVGQKGGLASVGLLGMLMRYSPDVETALRSLIDHFHFQVRGAGIKLDQYGSKAVLSWHPYEPGVPAGDQIDDGAIAELHNMLRELCGPEWKPTAVYFGHERPGDIAPFRAFFGAPMFFDSDYHALEFPATWLKHPLVTADTSVFALVSRQIEQVEARMPDDFPRHVRDVLRPAILAGTGSEERIAVLLSLNRRSFVRRLSAHGTTFRELSDEVHYELASQMLEYSKRDVAGIADALGFADASSFSRAFRRWSGTTPTYWREARKQTKA